MKADIIREQLVRVGKCDAADPLLTGLHVRACGDDVDGFHYRTRMDFVADQRGRLGLRSARSHNVIAVHECPLAVQAINDAEAFHQPWAAGATIRLAQAQSGTTVVADEETPATVTEAVGDIAFEVSAAGFWQVHRNAPAQFTALATELLQPKPGEFLLDLYGGVGLFAKTLGPVLGAGGRIVLVEGERVAGRYAKRNLRDLPHTEVVVERVDRWLADTRITKVDIVVLDPRFAKYKLGNTPIQRLGNGFLWAEGPAWSSVGRYLLFSDIPNNVQMRWLDDNGQVSVFRNPSNYSNGNAFDYQGRQVSCEHLMRRLVRYEHDGSITVVADSWNGMRLNSPNDLAPHRDGSIWFTDPPPGFTL